MRHDYDLPPEWPAMNDAERSAWLTQERCRRQAKRQSTATAKHLDDAAARDRRRAKARSDWTDVEDER